MSRIINLTDWDTAVIRDKNFEETVNFDFFDDVRIENNQIVGYIDGVKRFSLNAAGGTGTSNAYNKSGVAIGTQFNRLTAMSLIVTDDALIYAVRYYASSSYDKYSCAISLIKDNGRKYIVFDFDGEYEDHSSLRYIVCLNDDTITDNSNRTLFLNNAATSITLMPYITATSETRQTKLWRPVMVPTGFRFYTYPKTITIGDERWAFTERSFVRTPDVEYVDIYATLPDPVCGTWDLTPCTTFYPLQHVVI